MARYFKHLENDQVEEASAFQVLAILLLGVIYLLFAGLWRHLLIWAAALGCRYHCRPSLDGHSRYCPVE